MADTMGTTPSDEMELWCGVFGEGTVFSVKIPLNAKVEALRKEIYKARRYDAKTALAANDLTLFFARNETTGKWLVMDGGTKTYLRGGDPSGYLEMLEWDLLSAYFTATPAAGSLCVLVELPKSPVAELSAVAQRFLTEITIAIYEDDSNESDRLELKYYQEQGQLIRANCSDYCEQILTKIDAIYQKYPDEKILPFICVEGSSGVGKSQLAFALIGDRPWFYWLAVTVMGSPQGIYKNFASISLAFDTVVKRDNPMEIEDENVVLNTTSLLYTGQLWTYGFIYALLEHCRLQGKHCEGKMIRFDAAKEFLVKPCSRHTVRTLIDTMVQEKEKVPFFVLDEMSSNSNFHGAGKRLAAFQRNVFRVCGLVVIIMGTDSKISNLVSQSTGSYTKGHEWMTVVPRFPPYQLKLCKEAQSTWDLIVGRYPIVKQIAEHSRGRFARYFVDKVVKLVLEGSNVQLCDLLDDAFADVSLNTHRGKMFMDTVEGKLAQLIAISHTNVPPARDEPQRKKQRIEAKTSAMHLHFANLKDEGLTDVTLNKKLFVNDVPWKPICQFPMIEDDLLLYLAILGGKEYPSYYDYTSGKKLSTRHIFIETDSFPRHENTNAVSLDYKCFGNMAAHAIFCSSRRNGVRGIGFSDFFQSMLGEFQDEVWQQITMHDAKGSVSVAKLFEGYDDRVRALLDETIGFMAPPNSKWPACIVEAEKHHCKFGRLVRAVNADRCDSYVLDSADNLLFLCECKHWSTNVGVTTVEGIINGFETTWDWFVAMVFCVKLANSDGHEWKHPSVGCVCVSSKNGEVRWVSPLTKRARKQLVIVIETGPIQ